MAVELTGSSTPSARCTSSSGWTSKSPSTPSSRSSATLPSRSRPKWKSSPTTTIDVVEAVDQHALDEVRRLLARLRLVEVDDDVASTPVAASSSSFWSRSVSSCGADSAAPPRQGGGRR